VTTVLCTGAAGYIGSVLCPALLAAGHSVIAVDSFRYGQTTALAACCADPGFELIRGDARDLRLMTGLMKRADVIVPLAAIVGAPACVRSPDEARQVNQHAIDWVAAAASRDQLVVYPNTNSAYGAMPVGTNEPLDEDAPMKPLSLYAETKCRAEEAVLTRRGGSVVFRLATVFGASPRMRTDLLVNDLTLRAVRDGFAMLYSPASRRNYVHVRDVAGAFVWAIDAWGGGIVFGDTRYSNVFNLGHDESNSTKLKLYERIKEHVPSFEWAVGSGEDPDRRDYVVSSERLALAGFMARRTLDDGITELIKLYKGFPQHQWGNV
jgi:nucleoside-diphosphate-sugar epimerase